ncbi:LysE family translocator [Ornithinimicrobium sp. F0845]|uniref:LysE family translocator n=1 Tax=Ornithinimicrobium sp. F0845 TaxID=2926412 RepID=UPI001FF523B2|nr:LysE family translocator [Ornithinimicrobium sp. F0845]MCK0112238.1 LysE family translocator [Ornithinimicrobium sp. F0845]
MPSTATLLTFTLAAAALVVVPGPSVVYVVARGVEFGRRAGMVSVAGLEVGSLLHLVATMAGLATLLAAWPAGFRVLQWAGAAYLFCLALGQFRALRGVTAVDPVSTVGSRPTRLQLFRDGLLIDLLNPGTALFFLAFLPQFVDPSRGPVAAQILVLGTCYLVLAVINDSVYALAAGGLARRLTGSPRARGRTMLVTGVIYLGLAAVALLA